MDKKEVAEMFVYLKKFYPEMQVQDGSVEAWQEVIHFMRREEVYKVLREHIKESSFPPKIADIYKRWHGNMYPQSDHGLGE